MHNQNHLTRCQFDVIAHLVKRGHAMYAGGLAYELHKKFIGVDTMRCLRERGYVRMVDQGWLATEAAILRVQEGF